MVFFGESLFSEIGTVIREAILWFLKRCPVGNCLSKVDNFGETVDK
jgi:hypothetical protein